MKRHIQIIMSLVLMLSLVLSMTGCGNKNKEIVFEPASSAVYVCDDGTLLCATVEDFSASYYDIEELKAFVEEQVTVYNADKAGVFEAYESDGSKDSKDDTELPVAIRDCYTSDNNAVLILSCDDYSDYYEINNLYEYSDVITFVETATVKAMKEAGETINAGMFKADGSAISVDKVMKKNKYHVVKVSGTGTVYVQGIIKYVSADVDVNDEATAADVSGTEAYIVYK